MHNRRIVRRATPLTVVLSVSAILIAAACASSEEAPVIPEAQQTPDEQPTSKLPPPTNADNRPDATAPPGKQCVATCVSDSHCANSCPVPSTGVSCCDVVTGTCYTNAANSCPKTEDDDAGMTPAY